MAEIEHDIKVVQVNEATFLADCEKMRADGWQVIPGIVPIAIYPVFRIKEQPPADPRVGFAQGEMRMDDRLVGILRADGSYEHSDGRVDPPANKNGNGSAN